MKKLICLLSSFTLLFALALPVYAAVDAQVAPQDRSFEINLDDVLSNALAFDAEVSNGATKIPFRFDVNDELEAELVITVRNSLTRASSKSFSMEGWFRLKSNQEIVTVYGLDGTFEYNGSQAEPTGYSSYHNSCYSGWTGSSSAGEETNDDGSARIIGNFTVYKNGKADNTASCYAKCTKNGSVSFGGNYDEASTH
ncbi:MAG: hypothetical protein LBQ15_06015 [Clostridium sp.]|jgi:hypothetical protein|nr:hypothetical protein [Clostridium sp.]